MECGKYKLQHRPLVGISGTVYGGNAWTQDHGLADESAPAIVWRGPLPSGSCLWWSVRTTLSVWNLALEEAFQIQPPSTHPGQYL